MQYHLATVVVVAVLAGSAAAAPVSNAANLVFRDEPAWAHGTPANCTTFVVPKESDYCDKLAKVAGVTTKWFMDQNPQIDEKCGNLWTNTKYCIAPPKGQPGKDTIVSDDDVSKKDTDHSESDNKDSGKSAPGIERGIAFHNKSPHDICYAFEGAEGVTPPSDLPTSASCNVLGGSSYRGIIVPAGQWRFHSLNAGFTGAVTAITNGTPGARHEFTFVSGSPPGTFYDIDYEYGLSSSTLQPYDGRKLFDGRDSVVGEQNVLAKINHGFKKLSTSEQQALLTACGDSYIKQGSSGDLTWVHNTKEGPREMWYFLQLQAKLRGYVMSGSIDGVTPLPGSKHAELVAAADSSTRETSSWLFLITAYPDHRHRY